MSFREMNKEIKYAMVDCTIKYIEELTNKVYEQNRLLNKFIDELDLTDEEIDAPLGDLSNNEGGDRLRELIKNKLGWEE